MRKSLIVLMFTLVFSLGCSSDSDKTDNGTTDLVIESQNPVTPEGKEKLFEDILNLTMDRLRYRDKSYIYELEFPYYRDENSFDKFLENGKIRGAKADTLEFVDVVSLEMFEPDSAVVLAQVHFKGPTGKETILKGDKLTFYWYDNRWVRPTVSTYDAQRQIDDIRRTADSAAAAEEETGR